VVSNIFIVLALEGSSPFARQVIMATKGFSGNIAIGVPPQEVTGATPVTYVVTTAAGGIRGGGGPAAVTIMGTLVEGETYTAVDPAGTTVVLVAGDGGTEV
jgi:hypothetical protein